MPQARRSAAREGKQIARSCRWCLSTDLEENAPLKFSVCDESVSLSARTKSTTTVAQVADRR
jgi:hypothetical protein